MKKAIHKKGDLLELGASSQVGPCVVRVGDLMGETKEGGSLRAYDVVLGKMAGRAFQAREADVHSVAVNGLAVKCVECNRIAFGGEWSEEGIDGRGRVTTCYECETKIETEGAVLLSQRIP